MGKCSKCGRKIEYNSFRVVDDKIYCMKCVPEEKEEVAEILSKTIEESKVNLDELAAALGEVAPKKKRSRKKQD